MTRRRHEYKFAIKKSLYDKQYPVVLDAYDLYHNCNFLWTDLTQEQKDTCSMIPLGWRKQYSFIFRVLEKLDSQILSLYVMKNRIRVECEHSKDPDFNFAARIQLKNFYGYLNWFDIVNGAKVEWQYVREHLKIIDSPPMGEFNFMVWRNIHHEKTGL